MLLPFLFLAATSGSQASAETLAGYKYPAWFQDAKFGIWAHWGPQSVPGQGDWFARRLYEQGDPDYQYHVEHYGHPSRTGYKDIIPLWKAEKWDPDHLMRLYKKAGARYFVSMGVHHDNFDLWNSRYHHWNAVTMGPHRDVVGTWQKATKRLGLKFGVSEHLGASFTWFQDSHGSDKIGKLEGIPYDGADPRYWDLYHPPAKPGDTGWYSTDARWQDEWKHRIYDLIDNYHPDLLYSDGGVPFANEIGFGMIDHLYKTVPNVIYTCKQPSNGLWVEDFERGVMRGISPYPFQTDTSIGDWFYNVHWKFRDIKWVVDTLVDDVSKNGNLLLNVVQRPDGSLDPEVLTLLQQMADWMSINSEGIYGTRPWISFGEGKVRARGGSFGEDFAYSSDDIRFTTKGNALYAYCLGWPSSGSLDIRSLAKSGQSGSVEGVKLLGSKDRLVWNQDDKGLHITLPAKPVSQVAICFKIAGKRLRDFTPVLPEVKLIQPDSNGNLLLQVGDAELNGAGIATEQVSGADNIGFWDSGKDWVSWKVNLTAPGEYELRLETASPNGEDTLQVSLGESKIAATVPKTSAYGDYVPTNYQGLRVATAGVYTLAIHPKELGWKAMNLRAVRLTRVR